MASIDTVALRHESALPTGSELDSYRDEGWMLTFCAGRARLTHKHKDLPRLFWSSSYGKGWLTVEASLPSWLRGSNIGLLDARELDEALSSLSDYVSLTAQRDFDCHNALVGRVDFAHDFGVKETDIAAYIAAATALSLPRFEREAIGGTTVYFNSKTKRKAQQFVLYGKFRETIENPNSTAEQRREARNKLRLEIRFFGSGVRGLAARHGVSRRASNLLRTDIAFSEVQRAMKFMHLDKSKAAIDARVDALIKTYGFKKAEPLIGFLRYLDRFGEDFYALPGSDYGEKTYARRASLCRKAGVWARSMRPANLQALSLVQEPAEIHSFSNRADSVPKFVHRELRALK